MLQDNRIDLISNLPPKEQIKIKMEICKSCDSFDKDGFAGTGKCNACGCSVAMKIQMFTETCPLNKW